MRNIRRLPLPAHAMTWLGSWTRALPGELSACCDAKVLLPLYAAELRGGNVRRADVIADTIRRGALRSVLRDLVTASLAPGAAHANLASVSGAVRAHPEIRDWAGVDA